MHKTLGMAINVHVLCASGRLQPHVADIRSSARGTRQLMEQAIALATAGRSIGPTRNPAPGRTVPEAAGRSSRHIAGASSIARWRPHGSSFDATRERTTPGRAWIEDSLRVSVINPTDAVAVLRTHGSHGANSSS